MRTHVIAHTKTHKHTTHTCVCTHTHVRARARTHTHTHTQVVLDVTVHLKNLPFMHKTSLGPADALTLQLNKVLGLGLRVHVGLRRKI